MSNETIGPKIKEFRKKNNLTQDQLAESLGYSGKSVISHIEKGDADMTYEKILLLLRKYMLDANELFEVEKIDKKIEEFQTDKRKGKKVTAIKLVLKENTTFDIYYLNGVVKRYDILSLANKFPQLSQLKDRKLFLKGHLLGWSVVVWNDELDIDTETPYYDGVDVTNEYDDIENAIIGYKIKEKRLKLNLSQSQLAEKIGIDQSDLSKIEKGNANPSIKTIQKIVSGLDSKLSIIIE